MDTPIEENKLRLFAKLSSKKYQNEFLRKKKYINWTYKLLNPMIAVATFLLIAFIMLALRTLLIDEKTHPVLILFTILLLSFVVMLSIYVDENSFNRKLIGFGIGFTVAFINTFGVII